MFVGTYALYFAVSVFIIIAVYIVRATSQNVKEGVRSVCMWGGGGVPVISELPSYLEEEEKLLIDNN